jgi:hypothetical protein
MFDFGKFNSDDLWDNAKRGFELFKEGFLRLPFENVVFVADVTPPVGDGVGIKTSRLYVFASEIDNNDILINVFGDFRVKSSIGSGYKLIFAPMSTVIFSTHSEDTGKDILKYDTSNSDTNPLMNKDWLRIMQNAAIRLIVGGSMLLNTKGMPVTQKGNPLVFNPKSKEAPSLITYIDTNSYTRALTNTLKSTKRPHLRRGHIRNLADGRKVWVKDTMINFHLNGGIDATTLFSRKKYQFKHPHTNTKNIPDVGSRWDKIKSFIKSKVNGVGTKAAK